MFKYKKRRLSRKILTNIVLGRKCWTQCKMGEIDCRLVNVYIKTVLNMQYFVIKSKGNRKLNEDLKWTIYTSTVVKKSNSKLGLLIRNVRYCTSCKTTHIFLWSGQFWDTEQYTHLRTSTRLIKHSDKMRDV